MGKVNLTDAYVNQNGEVFIKQMNISPFEQGNIFNRAPLRDRKKLLLHKKEILKLTNQIQQDGYALIPLAVYLKGSLVKVSLAVAKG